MIRFQYIFESLYNESYSIQLKAIRRVLDGQEGHQFLKNLDLTEKGSLKYVIVDCNLMISKDLIENHIRDIYMSRSNFHYFMTNLVLDQFIRNKNQEFGAINITGFRIINRKSPFFKTFISTWRLLDPFQWPGAGSLEITVSWSFYYLLLKNTRLVS